MNDDMTRARSISMLREALEGAVFPLSAQQVVRVARENEAPGTLLTLLAELPSEEFHSLEAVESALGGAARARAAMEPVPASEC